MSNNIKVAIKVRPLISREKNDKLKEQWEVTDRLIYPIDSITGKKNGDSYCFDHIFGITCRNIEIYNTVVHPVVDAAMNGFNGTIFAYGQTSSGKTYTMMGDVHEPGLISIAVKNIFLAIERSINRKFLLRVSYMEIYNEKIYDLLDIKNTVKVHEDYNGSVVVNVKEVVTDTAEMVYSIMKQGDKTRKTGETMMNAESSRSHTIFRIIIESSDLKDSPGVVNVAHLNLVDLAGSERATHTRATGMRFKEGAHINKSLSALSLVMKQLSESQDFINFRDSKLTRILQPSLGGNALTVIICAVTPAALEETHSTLAFASRAKTVKNKPQLNEVVSEKTQINRYAMQIDKLKKELQKAIDDKQNLQVQMNVKLKEKIADLEKFILYSSSVKKKKSAKNRRKTWCALSHNDSSHALPIIYESEFLKLETDKECSETDKNDDSILNIDQMDIEDFQIDDCDLLSMESEKKPFTNGIKRENSLDSLRRFSEESENGYDSRRPSENGSEINENSLQVFKQSDDFLRWVTSENDTPKSVLRERAAYYEREFTSLKELTSKEKELLFSEQSVGTESLQAELDQTKNVLEFERNVRNQIEIKFDSERKQLQTKIEELEKRNSELSRTVYKAQKEQEKNNDCEYLVELYKEKYLKREKELLDSLKEARESSQMSSFYFEETEDKTTSTMEVSQEMRNFLQTVKEQLHLLQSEITTEQPVQNILDVLNNIMTKYKEIIEDTNTNSEDVQDLLMTFKSMLEISSILLKEDNLLSSMETEKVQLINKITHLQIKQRSFDAIVKKKDEELKALSEKMQQYLDQLDESKTELEKFKSSVKSEMETTPAPKDIEQVCADLKVEEKTSIVIKQEQDDYILTIKLKDKEIEELSDKIMDYIDQLAACEEELKNLKSVPISSTEKDLIPLKNEIQTLSDQLTSSQAQLIASQAEIEKCKTTLESNQELLKVKDQEATDLSLKIESYSSQLSSAEEELEKLKSLLEAKKEEMEVLSEEVTSYKNQLAASVEQIEEYKLAADKVQEKSLENEMLTKDLAFYKSELATTEEHLQMTKQDLLKENDLVQVKEREIEHLTKEVKAFTEKLALAQEEETKIRNLSDELTTYKNQLTAVENELQKCQLDMNKEKELILQEKEAEINKLVEEVTLYKDKLIASEDQIETFKLEASKSTDLAQEKELNFKTLNEEVEKYKSQLIAAEKQLENYKSAATNEMTLVQAKQDEIKVLTEEVAALKTQLNSAKEDVEKFKLDISVEKNVVQEKETEVKNLTEEIITYKTLLTTAEEQLQSYQSDASKEKDLLQEKEAEVNALTEELITYKDRLTAAEENLNEEKDLSHEKNIKINELDQELIQLKTQLASKEEELEKCKLDVDNEKSLVQLKELEIKELTEKIKYYADTINAQEEKIKIQANNKDNKDNVRELLQNIAHFTSQLEEKNEELFTLTEKLNICTSKLSSKEEELTKLSQSLLDTTNELTSCKEDLVNCKSSLKTNVELLQNKDEELNDLSGKLSVLQDQLFAKEEELENFKSEAEAEKTRVMSKTNIFQDLDDKMLAENNQSKCFADLQAKNEQIVLKESEIEELNDKIKNYSTRLTVSEAELEKSKTEINQKIDLLSQKDQELQKLTKDIEVYTQRLNVSEDELEKVKSSLKSTADQLQLREQEIVDLSQKLIACNKQLSEKDEEVNKMKNIETSYKNLRDTIKLKDKEIEELSDKIMDYINQLTDCENELEKYKSKPDTSVELAELQASIANYKNQIISLENELQEGKSTIDATQEQILLKNSTIQELSEKVSQYTDKMSLYHEDLLKTKHVLNVAHDDLKHKDEEIQDLFEKILFYTCQLDKQEEQQNKVKLILKEKDNEIEELSDKLMEYLNQLTACEDELNKYKSISKMESLSQTEDYDSIKTKDEEIMKLREKIEIYSADLSACEEKLRQYQLIPRSNKYTQTIGDALDAILKQNIIDIDLIISKYNSLEHLPEANSIPEFNWKDHISLLNEVNNICSKLKSEIDEKFANILKIFELQTKLKQEIELWNSLVSKMNTEIQHLKSQCVAQNSELALAENKVKYMNSIKTELETTKLHVVNIQNNLELLQKNNLEYSLENNNLKSEIATIKTVMQKNLDEFRSEQEQYKLRYEMLMNEKTNIQENSLILSNQYRDSVQNVETLSMELTSVTDMLKCKINELETLKKDLVVLNQNIEYLKNDNQQLSNQNESFKKELCCVQNILKQQEEKYKNELMQNTQNLISDKNKSTENNKLLTKKYAESVNKAEALQEELNLTINRLQEQNNEIANLRKEIETLKQCDPEKLQQEISHLRKCKHEYKKTAEDVTQKANTKLMSYRNIIQKLRSENEVLKSEAASQSNMRVASHIEATRSRAELEKQMNEINANATKLQQKVIALESQNEKFTQLTEHLQEQAHRAGYDLNKTKKKMDSLNQENMDLLKDNAKLKENLKKTEEVLNSTITALRRLEKEKDNSNENTRVLEESLEDIKHELYEIKHKERIKSKRAQRQSLHDSSRSFSEQEAAAAVEHQAGPSAAQSEGLKEVPGQYLSYSSSGPRPDCESCRCRIPLLERQIQTHAPEQMAQLQAENSSLRGKNEQLKELCKLRRAKIDDLERQIQARR